MIYLVLFVDRATRCIISWALVSQRTFDTLQPLADAVWQHSAQHSAQSRVFYSDQLETYRTLLYRDGTHKPQPDKSQTYSVEGCNADRRLQRRPKAATPTEGCNADLRCYVSALVRRTRGFARSVESLRSMIWLWLFCDNRRCLAVPRAWARQWPPLRATCEDAEQEKSKSNACAAVCSTATPSSVFCLL